MSALEVPRPPSLPLILFIHSFIFYLFYPDYPKDISPLVLTSATQELFGCCADRDVTRESPHKLLKKEDIIQDIKRRAAVSDFSPVKQIVLVRLSHCYGDDSVNTHQETDDTQTPSHGLWEQTKQFHLLSPLCLILL